MKRRLPASGVGSGAWRRLEALRLQLASLPRPYDAKAEREQLKLMVRAYEVYEQGAVDEDPAVQARVRTIRKYGPVFEEMMEEYEMEPEIPPDLDEAPEELVEEGHLSPFRAATIAREGRGDDEQGSDKDDE